MSGEFPHAHRRARRLLRIIPLIFLLAISARAGVIVDSASGVVGQEMRIAVRLTEGSGTPGEITFQCLIRLSNETLFYPERILAPSGGRLISGSLQRIDERTWSIDARVELDDASGDSLFAIAGEALAGYDSIGVITLSEITIDGVAQPEASARIYTQAIGSPLRYIRFARLEPGYPNPATRGTSVTWTYQIDRPSEVRFGIYAMTGERLIEHDLGIMPAGRHRESLEIRFDVPSAAYFARLSTSHGEAIQFFHVIK